MKFKFLRRSDDLESPIKRAAPPRPHWHRNNMLHALLTVAALSLDFAQNERLSSCIRHTAKHATVVLTDPSHTGSLLNLSVQQAAPWTLQVNPATNRMRITAAVERIDGG